MTGYDTAGCGNTQSAGRVVIGDTGESCDGACSRYGGECLADGGNFGAWQTANCVLSIMSHFGR